MRTLAVIQYFGLQYFGLQCLGLQCLGLAFMAASVSPASAAYKKAHVDNIANWMVTEWTSDLPNEPRRCIVWTPFYSDKYSVSVDFVQTVPIGPMPDATVRVSNEGWHIAAGSAGSVEVEFKGQARKFAVTRVDETMMGGPTLTIDESTMNWLDGMFRAPIKVRLPHDLGFTVPAAPAGVLPAARDCLEKLVVRYSHDPFAKQAKADPPAQQNDNRDPFAAAQPPASAAVASAARPLRARPNADQMKAILKPGFDPVPALIEAPDKTNEAAFVALDFVDIEGVVGFIETLNAGRTPDQNVQLFKDEQQKKCANTATFRTVSQEQISGIRFDRLTYTCREPGKEAMNGDLLIATDASRSQSIFVLGSTEKDSEIHRRADLIFAGYEKTYR